MLFELGGEIYSVTDHGEFQPLAIAHRAEHDATRRRRQPTESGVRPAARRSAAQRSAASITASAARKASAAAVGRGRDRAERGKDAVAQELVDAAAVADDQGADPALVVLQELHDLVGLQLGRQPREAAQIDGQDGDVAQLAFARLDRHGGAADARRRRRDRRNATGRAPPPLR